MLGRLVISLLLTGTVSADVIVLKNGRTIQADFAQESGGKVRYTVGENTFTIPRDLVERIDTGGGGIVTSPVPLPISPPPQAGIPAPADLEAKIVHDGGVDTETLATVERTSGPNYAAAANWMAARFFREHGDLNRALTHLVHALTFLPENVNLLCAKAALLEEMSRFPQAVSPAAEAVRLAPKSAYAFALLGYAQQQMGDSPSAIMSLERSLALQPDDSVRRLLAAAKLDASSSTTEETSAHFRIQTSGGSVSTALRREVLAALEAAYSELCATLDYTPSGRIPVIVYSDRAYFEAGDVPPWASAYNDGKLRVSVAGLATVSPGLVRTLKHELAHSFVAGITNRRCPTWLNEGVAQWLEPRSLSADGHKLATLYAAHRQIPLNRLEGNFLEFSGPEAVLAYAESLAAVNYIADANGPGSVASLLRRIGEGSSVEAALRAVCRSGYSGLEDELDRSLNSLYAQ